jgi:ADP-heptose:LPS heptosyltransferase
MLLLFWIKVVLFSSETDISDPNNAYLVIVISDGEENASKHWSASRLKERIDELQATNRWTFVYMGCNQDVLVVEKEYNLSPQNVYKGWTGDDTTSLQMMASGSESLYDYMCERNQGKTSKADYFK